MCRLDAPMSRVIAHIWSACSRCARRDRAVRRSSDEAEVEKAILALSEMEAEMRHQRVKLAGLVLAAAGSKLIMSQMTEVSGVTPLLIAAVPAGLLCVAMAASWLPARHAARVPITTVLRD